MPASPDTIFSKILRGEIPATFLHQDDRCVAIRDIRPAAPLHALVIPRKAIASLAEAVEADASLLGHLLVVARAVAEAAGYGAAFRVVANSGAGAGQSVPHLHFHVLGGRPLTWPPGIGRTASPSSRGTARDDRRPAGARYFGRAGFKATTEAWRPSATMMPSPIMPTLPIEKTP